MEDLLSIYDFKELFDGIEPIKPEFFLPVFDETKEYLHSAMIDWLTLKIDLSLLPESTVRQLQAQSSKLFKISPDGELEWESYSWDSVKSDTHQVCIRVGSEFWVQGSPARLGLPNNCFGSLDIQYCATKMICFVRHFLNIDVPDFNKWRCTRIDITRNYLMQSGAEARQALAYLKQSPDRRQKHSFESNGLYIGKGSSLRKGKIYLKGEDAKRNQRSGKAQYTDRQLLQADRLLRAELTIASHGMRRLREDKHLNWFELIPSYLMQMHTEYFREYLSTVEVTDMSNVLEKLMAIAPTEGKAEAAYDCYMRIRLTGFEQAKSTYTKTSWYRHIGYLKDAGFTHADLQCINVIPLRKRAIEVSEPVRHWNDIPLISAMHA